MGRVTRYVAYCAEYGSQTSLLDTVEAALDAMEAKGASEVVVAAITLDEAQIGSLRVAMWSTDLDFRDEDDDSEEE